MRWERGVPTTVEGFLIDATINVLTEQRLAWRLWLVP